MTNLFEEAGCEGQERLRECGEDSRCPVLSEHLPDASIEIIQCVCEDTIKGNNLHC